VVGPGLDQPDDGERAQGVYVTTEDDVTYLDFSSQLVNTNLGHQYPSVVRAIQEQAATLATLAPQHGYEKRYRAAEMILDHSFEGAAKVFSQTAVPRPLNTPCEWPNCTRVDPRCSRRIAAITAPPRLDQSDR